MAEQGWIKLHRKFINWEWYDEPTVKSVFIDLILNANHQATAWHGHEIEKGSFVTSVADIAARNGLTTQQVRSALKKLEKTGEISKKATNKNTLIIVLGYAKYQDLIDTEQQTNNKQTTNKQQTNNKQTTNSLYNKNEKNEKNEENEENIHKRETIKETTDMFISAPSLDEIKRYISENSLKTNAQDFYDYYEGNGWTVARAPMKNWKAMCRKWSRSQITRKGKSGEITRPPTYDLEAIKKRARENTSLKDDILKPRY